MFFAVQQVLSLRNAHDHLQLQNNQLQHKLKDINDDFRSRLVKYLEDVAVSKIFFIVICDVMGQNQSHVAKHEMAEICILFENVKICPFCVFIKNKIFV